MKDISVDNHLNLSYICIPKVTSLKLATENLKRNLKEFCCCIYMYVDILFIYICKIKAKCKNKNYPTGNLRYLFTQMRKV